MAQRLGIDVGGTFTDVVVVKDDGTVAVEKVPSTPGDPSQGIFDGVRKIEASRGIVPADITIFAQGSTVATNALLEFKLPKTALIVTAGFADVLEIGDQVRIDAFDLRVDRPASYVTRDMVFEIEERVDRLGNVITEMTDEAVDAAIDAVVASGAEALAVCFLFSFRNPEHEQRVAERMRERAPGVEVAISSSVAPELGEYGRANTTAVSATLQPLIARYMNRIVQGCAEVGLTSPTYVMQSNGGVMSIGEAAENAHRMVLSGPAGGVLAATKVAGTSGQRNLITFDMGGTSTDIALIADAKATLVRQTEFDHKPLLVPQFDIHTIGSGGGSLARVDESGLLRVGPESAGAQPGPASYGRGGTRPTTTDAQVVLGRVDPDRFLGGEMKLDLEAARTAVQVHIADLLDVSVEEAALGILQVADTVMAKGVRVVSVNRGFDPRDFHVLPFGGAGPMHAASVAQAVGAVGVLVPQNPGIFSALGMAGADLKYDYTQVIDEAVLNLDIESLQSVIESLIEKSETRLLPAGAEQIVHVRQARMRYAWQDNDLVVPFIGDTLTETVVADAVDEFHRRHQFEFGHSDPEGLVEIAAVGIESTGLLLEVNLGGGDGSGVYTAETDVVRPVYFEETKWVDTPIFERASLLPGAFIEGPAIIEEREATTVVPPFSTAEVDRHLNIAITFVQH
ncbi:hydantoinase/oxoprolinase family protein [Subtercola endophyticus]|uniref:hydantoinase/oxoprolinase family protein n=1 Tax=Subtercola endophyticus TaxID=2895559 RepID=UPI001E390C53|nr:hydantoinase/oxoprolinase family protein [Subtercola endophyticus]UFS58607.1 hydantoinase/oxoprolinase family protein [Subtercola endophyticus]